MYSLEQTQWPFIKVSFLGGTTVAESQCFLQDLRSLVAMRERFGVILETDGKSPLTPTERKEFAAWFKQHKPDMRILCVGLVRLSPDPSFLARLSLKALNAAMPFAVSIAKTEGEALTWLQQRL